LTFTVLARHPRTGELGIGLATYSLGAGGYCPYIRPGVGAVSTQAFTNPALGPVALDLLAAGASPDAALTALDGHDEFIEYRQVGIVSADGAAAAGTGARARKWSGHLVGEGLILMGNVLAGQQVLDAMKAAFAAALTGPFDSALLAALEAGQAAGGQRTEDGRSLNVRSACLLVYGQTRTPLVDLRVDVHDDALGELRRVHTAYGPYVPYYALRASRPDLAPPQDTWARKQVEGRGEVR
jgi:uncharacterized Ntn-hydrolase superfamily protein